MEILSTAFLVLIIILMATLVAVLIHMVCNILRPKYSDELIETVPLLGNIDGRVVGKLYVVKRTYESGKVKIEYYKIWA